MNRRLPAEWESQSGVQITWPNPNMDWGTQYQAVLEAYKKIAYEISKREKLLIITENQESTLKSLSKCNLDNISIVQIPSNDVWTRDHGAITIVEDNSPILLDFSFNGWGEKYSYEKDNRITQSIHKAGIFGNTSIKKIDLVLEGGSIESNGYGAILTTSSCLLSPKRNPGLKKKQIEQKLKDELGTNEVLWLNYGQLEGDDTDGHIDTLARFVSSNSIVYSKCYNTNDSHYIELSKMEEELTKFKEFNLIPIPLPSPCFNEFKERLPATYANFLILNEAVLLPVYGVKEDMAAEGIIKDIFPEREIVPINCLPLIHQFGSLHCITMQFPDGVLSF